MLSFRGLYQIHSGQFQKARILYSFEELTIEEEEADIT